MKGAEERRRREQLRWGGAGAAGSSCGGARPARRGEDGDADEDGDAGEVESNGRMGPLLEKEIFGCLTFSLCVTQTLEWVAGLGLRCWRQPKVRSAVIFYNHPFFRSGRP